jgi:hypothetical protein
MKTRPWPLVILAVLQFFAPLATILFNSAMLGVKPTYVLGWILEKSWFQIFETLLLMPIAGIAIYQMKRWGYFVFFACMGWGLGSNIQALSNSPGSNAIWFLLVVFALPVVLALYFLLPSVRRTYFDPSVRWWEAKRRYLLEIPILVEIDGKELNGKLQNISEGGVALTLEESQLRDAQQIPLRFNVAGVDFKIHGMVMYSMQPASGPRAYGVRFLHTRETAHRYAELMRGLELIGVVHRDQDAIQPWYLGVRDWLVTLLTTGKGLVPDVNRSARKNSK